MALLCVAVGALGVWALTRGRPDHRRARRGGPAGRRGAGDRCCWCWTAAGSARALAATVRRSPLWGLLRLEGALSDAHAPPYGCGRRTGPGCGRSPPPPARRPGRAGGATAPSSAPPAPRGRRGRLVRWGAADAALTDLGDGRRTAADGYVEGCAGSSRWSPRCHRRTGRAAAADDDAEWDAALDDLNRAVETRPAAPPRWLSALAACAELRDDPVARESAARWTLDMAALRTPTRSTRCAGGRPGSPPTGRPAARRGRRRAAAGRRPGRARSAGRGRPAPHPWLLAVGDRPLGVRAGAGPAGSPGGPGRPAGGRRRGRGDARAAGAFGRPLPPPGPGRAGGSRCGRSADGPAGAAAGRPPRPGPGRCRGAGRCRAPARRHPPSPRSPE